MPISRWLQPAAPREAPLICEIERPRLQQGGIRLPGERGQEVRNRVLEAWIRNHPPDRPGKLRRSRDADVRARFS